MSLKENNNIIYQKTTNIYINTIKLSASRDFIGTIYKSKTY